MCCLFNIISYMTSVTRAELWWHLPNMNITFNPCQIYITPVKYECDSVDWTSTLRFGLMARVGYIEDEYFILEGSLKFCLLINGSVLFCCTKVFLFIFYYFILFPSHYLLKELLFDFFRDNQNPIVSGNTFIYFLILCLKPSFSCISSRQGKAALLLMKSSNEFS